MGTVKVAEQAVRQTSEYVGRVQATDRVNVVARVTAFLDQRSFAEGSEVKKGDLLYRLERGPFEADVQAKQAAIANLQAQLKNAQVTLERAQALLHTPAGQQSTVDAALAAQQSLVAQIQGAQAQLRQSQINLDYTEIHAPIDGKIGRTAVTVGNVVSPGSGVLTTIVSQDPMYVVFPVAVHALEDLRQRYPGPSGYPSVVVRLRMGNGKLYEQTGKIDFIDNTVATTTDTMTVRAEIANPPLAAGGRELVDNEVVTVVLEAAEPTMALTIPRQAVLTDQQGDYVYVVGADNKAEQRRITLGPSTPETAVVTKGLVAGESVIVEGVQRIRPGETVAPAPVASGPNAAAR